MQTPIFHYIEEAMGRGDGRECVTCFFLLFSFYNHVLPTYQLSKISNDHMVRMMAV